MKYAALVKINGQYGYIDKTGSIIIEPRFNNAASFKEGLAYFEEGAFIGFINSRGEKVIQFESAHYFLSTFFSQQRAPVFQRPRLVKGEEKRKGDVVYCTEIEIPESAGFIDTEGIILIKPEYDWVDNFCEGLAAVAKGTRTIGSSLINPQGKWGYIDRAGKLVIPMDYETARPFCEGLAAVKQNGLWGYIDKKGNMVIKPQFKNAFEFQGGMAAVYNGKKYGFINQKGDVVIDYKFDSANNLQEGFIAVNIGAEEETFIQDNKYVTGGHWFFIDSSGNTVDEKQYLDVKNYSEGLAFLYSSGMYGVVDTKGNEVTPFQYDDAKEFKNGLAPVLIGEKWGYINTKGELVIKPQFDEAFQFIAIE